MKNLVIFVSVSLLVAACGASPVDSAIKQVEKALERVEKNKDTMTRADWEALDKELTPPLEVINTALENDEIGVVGKVKVVMLVAKVTTVMAEQGMKTLESEAGLKEGELMDALKQAAGE